MDPIAWLCANAPGFIDLSDKERAAILHFSLLWSFFEAKALNTEASARSILTLAQNWVAQDRLRIDPFGPSLEHFRNRYIDENGNTTTDFNDLNFRSNDNAALVSAVLKGEDTNLADSVAALLIVVYRLRNNLFHGMKWAYGIRGQLENFTHANVTLMAALEIQGLAHRE